jgi:molybdopterin-guanine dinucleotide biosynthesis adapter protein
MPESPGAAPLPVVGFVGLSGSGKTTLIERLVPILTARGLRVGVLKHAQRDFDVDRPGKDSYRARAAGASQVLIASRRRWALLAEEKEPEAEPRLARTLARFTPGQVDLVLVEGFAHEAYPKIEVYRPSRGQPPKCWPADPEVVAVATDEDIPGSAVPRLDLNDPPAVAEFVLQLLQPGGAGSPALARPEVGDQVISRRQRMK